MGKWFYEGEAVEVKRDTTFGCAWEPAVYKRATADTKGWHWVVVRPFGESVLVPSRRIRTRTKDGGE